MVRVHAGQPISARDARGATPLPESFMSHLPKDWRFLRAGWVYALILTGREDAATKMVEGALQGIIRRHDVVSVKRRRRLFFAMLFREGRNLPCVGEGAGERVGGLRFFHELAEPGRSALSLLYLRLFSVDELADVLGKSEKELPDILAGARGALSGKWPAAV